MQALKLVDLTISAQFLQDWLKRSQADLEYNSAARRDFEKHFRKELEYGDSTIFIMPHEFLLLLCNCSVRSEIIQKCHKGLEATKEFDYVIQWELVEAENRRKK